MKTLKAMIGLCLVPVLLPLVCCTVLLQSPEYHEFRRSFFAAVRHDARQVYRALVFGDLGTGIFMLVLTTLGTCNFIAHNWLAGISCVVTATIISLR